MDRSCQTRIYRKSLQSFGFSISPAVTSLETLGVGRRPSRSFASERHWSERFNGRSTGSWVTVKIYAVSRQSVTERPIPISFTLRVERGSELERDIRYSERYGRPIEAPTGSVLNGSVGFPAALSKTSLAEPPQGRGWPTPAGPRARSSRVAGPA